MSRLRSIPTPGPARSGALAAAVLLLVGGALPAAPAAAQARKAAKKKEAKVAKPVKPRDYARTFVVLKTTAGEITIRFFFDKAPNHVKSFVDLAATGFYDGTLFHRVIPDFIVQGGDPLTKDPNAASVRWGTGGRTDADGRPITIKQEFNDLTHRRGIVSMARASDPDSASSQFFIVVKDYPSLDRRQTVFGEVTKGMEIVDKIVADSNSDLLDPSGGKPRNYQKLLKVELGEEVAP